MDPLDDVAATERVHTPVCRTDKGEQEYDTYFVQNDSDIFLSFSDLEAFAGNGLSWSVSEIVDMFGCNTNFGRHLKED